MKTQGLRSGGLPGSKGFTYVEILVAGAALAIIAIVTVQALAVMNEQAASMRSLSNAKTIVQRNIERALAVPFSSSTSPTILGITNGAVWDDDGSDTNNDGYNDSSTADNVVNVAVTADGKTKIVSGTLTRIVTADTAPSGWPIRRVTFRLTYTYLGKLYTYSATTLRTYD